MILLDDNRSLVDLFVFQQSTLCVFQSHKNSIRYASLQNKSAILYGSRGKQKRQLSCQVIVI